MNHEQFLCTLGEREMGEMIFFSAHFAALVGNQELSSLI